ncbi:hypothetical protein ECZC03_47890 [Escherichia coli]|nr:hypothetical protein ECZC03_47890 [Escherichia coli]
MTKYQGYDVTDATHKTSIHNDWKVVVAKKKPARGVTLTIGIFFDGTGNNRENTASRLIKFNECSAARQGVNQKMHKAVRTFLKKLTRTVSRMAVIVDIIPIFTGLIYSIIQIRYLKKTRRQLKLRLTFPG